MTQYDVLDGLLLLAAVFERTSLQRAYVIPCRKWGPLHCPTGTPQRIGDCSQHAVLATGA